MMKSTLISIFIHNLGYSIHTMYAPVNTGGIARAGLTIGQTGQMPKALRLHIETLLYWFFMFLSCSPHVKIIAPCDDCV